jgi:hypothetical protein
MIDFTQGVFESPPFVRVHLNGNWCNINEEEFSNVWAELKEHLAKGGKIFPEPQPTAPTPEQLAAAEAAQAQAEIDALEIKSLRGIREWILANPRSKDVSQLLDIEDQIAPLREVVTKDKKK